MTTETQEVRLESGEPLKVAQEFLFAEGRTENNKLALVEFRGDMWYWDNERWVIKDLRWLEDKVFNWLEDAVVPKWNKKEEVFEDVPYGVTPFKMQQVVRALQAKIRVDEGTMPQWLIGHPPEPWKPDFVLAFKDVLLDVQTGLTRPRDETWFDGSIMPVKYDPEAKCPRWDRCLKEWGGEDERWAILLQRIMGYALLNQREYAKWFLMYGKVRSGKGVIRRILQRLMGKDVAMSTSLEDLVANHGMDGMQHAKLLIIGEVAELISAQAQHVSRLIKNIVGRDPITVNPKFQRQLRNIMCPAAVILQSNEVPRLPNKGRGLSSKMIPLPFDVSFENNPQFDLEEELAGELPGIAAWVARGAADLVKAETPDKQWPIPSKAMEMVRQYHLENNMFDNFLDDLFVPDKLSFLPSVMLGELWDKWCDANGVRTPVPRTRLVSRIVAESSWAVHSWREANGGRRGIRGLSMKVVRDE